MRWNRLFWPLILIVGGGLLLLDNLKIIRVNIWEMLIPIALILLGLSALMGSVQRASRGPATSLSIPAEGVEKASVRVNYGAGRVSLTGQELPGQLLTGQFEGGVEDVIRREGSALNVELNATSDGPWAWWDGGRREWSLNLSQSIPLSLRLSMGASEARLDLTNLKVTDLRLETGASSTTILMPANAGLTTARVEGGAASIVIRVPAEVGARIQSEGALSSLTIDSSRFAKSGNVHETKNYAEAKNKLDLKVEMGVGSVAIQ